MYGQATSASINYNDSPKLDREPECNEIGQTFGNALERNAQLIKDIENKLNQLSTIPNEPGIPMKESSPDTSFCSSMREGINRFSRQNDHLERLFHHLSKII